MASSNEQRPKSYHTVGLVSTPVPQQKNKHHDDLTHPSPYPAATYITTPMDHLDFTLAQVISTIFLFLRINEYALLKIAKYAIIYELAYICMSYIV